MTQCLVFDGLFRRPALRCLGCVLSSSVMCMHVARHNDCVARATLNSVKCNAFVRLPRPADVREFSPYDNIIFTALRAPCSRRSRCYHVAPAI